MAAALGIIAYFATRGFFLADDQLITVNPYGFMALAGVVGLFSDRPLVWLWETGQSAARRVAAQAERS